MSLYWDSEDLLLIQSLDFKREVDAMLQKDFSPSTAELIDFDNLPEKELSFIERIERFIINRFFQNFI